MKHTIRVLALVVCLLAVWMVTRGSNGCAPMPDNTATLIVEGDATHDSHQAGAEVYGSGKLGTLNSAGVNREITLKWYTILQGDSLEGMVTIVSTQGNRDKHIHQTYQVSDGGSYTINISNKTLR